MTVTQENQSLGRWYRIWKTSLTRLLKKRLVPLLFTLTFCVSSGLVVPQAKAVLLPPLKGFQIHTLHASPAKIAQDINEIARLGGNMIRFPLYLDHTQGDPSLEANLALLDTAIATARPHRMTVVADVHRLPNHQNFDSAQFVQIWRTIATRYQNQSPKRLWYDLLNEPSKSTWRNDAQAAAQAIRAIDQRHKIVFAPNGTTTVPAKTVRKLKGINNQVLEFHFYNWYRIQCPEGINAQPATKFQCTEPGGVRPPRAYPSPQHRQTKTDLERLLQDVKAAGQRNQVPVFIGEVAIPRQHPNAARFLRDFTSISKELGIPLTVHAFREADVWNYERNPKAWSVLTRWLRS